MRNAIGIAQAADHLAQVFGQVVPLASSSGRKTGKDRQALANKLERFYAEAREQRRELRLGIIGRARLAFALQQRLLAAKYPADLVKQVLFALLAAAFVGRDG